MLFHMMRDSNKSDSYFGHSSKSFDIVVVLPDDSYCLIFLTFFRIDVNLEFSVMVAAEGDPEP